ncbi:MAG: Gfo/Idh/MocA family oxidoreductase [Candidatus Latescibacteria bacterium]|nr:Gfo/Idh/MocA family oxidoreductase [Candidatus Latescibacterota bacterium]
MKVADKDTLRVAVVGGGNIAQHHLKVLKELPGVEVIALADADPQALRESAERFSIPQRWPSHRHLLKEERPDAVFVLVSVGRVAEVAATFIREGIPTFLEKPPGLYAAHTRRLAELAGQRRTLAMVGVNRRFYSSLLRGRELLLESGPVRSLAIEAHEDLARVRGNPKWPAEVIRRWSAANGIHALDLLRFFGGEVAQVQVLRQAVEGPGPDCCAALIRFAQGAVGRALMDHFSPGGHRFEVRSLGATLTSEPGFAAAVLQRRGAGPLRFEPDELDQRYKPGFFRQDQTFLECVRRNTALPFPACGLEDAARTMELIETIAGIAGEAPAFPEA